MVPELDKLPDGVPVTVQLPDEGKPLKATLAVAVPHVGCVIVPTVGADALLIVSVLVDVALEHPVLPVEVKVRVTLPAVISAALGV